MKLLFNLDKAYHVANYLIRKADNSLNKTKFLKLVWAADRYHLRNYGRPICFDIYYAMKNGPVLSNMKNIIDGSLKINNYLPFILEDNILSSQERLDLDSLSETDLEALNFALSNFIQFKEFDLVEICHRYPEWVIPSKFLSNTTKRKGMQYEHFFLDPEVEIPFLKKDVFKMDENRKKLAQESFDEIVESCAIFT